MKTPLTLITIAILIALTALRIWYMTATDISMENAYYHLCAQHPAAAYYDTPAATPLSITLTTKLLSSPSEKHWLLLAPVWALLASLAAWWFALQVGKPNAAAVTVIILNALPPFNLASLQVGPDLPALTFLLVGLATVWRTLRLQRSSNKNWYIAATCFAAAALFSYAAALLALLTIPLLYSKTRRNAGDIGAITGQALLALTVLAALVPAIWWHAQNDWLAIKDWNRATLTHFDLTAIQQSLLDPLPILLLLLCLAALGLFRQNIPLVLLALPSLAVALFFAYRGWNILVATLLAAAILLPTITALRLRGTLKTATLCLLPLILATVNAFLIKATWEESRLATEATQKVRAKNKRIKANLPEPLFLIGGDDRLAAKLAYDLRNDFVASPSGYPLAFRREDQGRVDQFTFWPSYDEFIETTEAPDPHNTEVMGASPFAGRSAIYVGREAPENIPTTIREGFSDVEEVARVTRGRQALYIYLCLEYDSLPL